MNLRDSCIGVSPGLQSFQEFDFSCCREGKCRTLAALDITM